ncbi:MAG: hypothetical protein RR413_10050 [Christensenellaceae bacterium]
MPKTIEKETVEKKSEVLVDEEKELLKNQLKMQSEQMATLMENFKKLQTQMQYTGGSQTEETIEVGCRINNGTDLCSKDESVTIHLDCGEEAEIFVSDFKLILGNPFGYKELFKKDILYFVDEANYQRFRIKKDISLEKDEIISRLTLNSVTNMIEWAKKITNEKHNLNVMYCLLYLVANLYSSGELKDWGYESRTSFEKYFDVEVDRLVQNLAIRNS